MNKLRLALALFIVLGSWGCGERPPKPLTYKELPIAKDYDQYLEYANSPPTKMNLHVVSSNQFMIGYCDGTGLLTNATGISTIVHRRCAVIGGSFPFIIWAKKEAPFEDVWRGIELGATNRHFKLAVQDGEKPKRKLTTLFQSDSELGCREHYFVCGDARFMELPSNLVVIVCAKDRLTLNNAPCSFRELERSLWRARTAATAAKSQPHIQILATGDCPYQSVIDVLGLCRSCGLGFTNLGLQPAEAPPLTTDDAK
jgi:hypothetical protein